MAGFRSSASLERLDARVPELLHAFGAPGAAVAITDRAGALAVRVYGLADVAARRPVEPDTLFEIGSIGKSFTAACLMQLVEQGRVDLQAPVTEYLPWFEVRSRFAPITVHHLLNHTAGIITGSDVTSDSRFDVWALRSTETGAPPGERWQYSNIGYRTLGFLLEEVEGRSYADIVRSRVLEPLGMGSTEPVITNAMRPRLAVGYAAHPDDRPVRYEAPVVPATWLETGTGDGCIASTARDMATYLRVWLNRGRGLVSEDSFERMTVGGGFEYEEGAIYGYGLVRRRVDGRTFLGHGGDMVGYASRMACEPETGFGVVVLTNCLDWEDWSLPLSRDVLGWLRCEARGQPLPAPEPRPDPVVVEDASDFAGRYRGTDGDLVVRADGDRLFLGAEGGPVRLQRRPGDRFLVDDEEWALFLLSFERDQSGSVVAVCHGPRRWHRREVSPETPPILLPAFDGYVGHYRSTNPWTTNFRVVLRESDLLLITPQAREEPLETVGDDAFRVGSDPRSPERLAFDAIVDGKALRANLSGCDYYRAFTP